MKSPTYNDVVNMMYDNSEHHSMIDQESLIGPPDASQQMANLANENNDTRPVQTKTDTKRLPGPLQENYHARRTSRLLRALESEFGDGNQISFLRKECEQNKSCVAESPCNGAADCRRIEGSGAKPARRTLSA